MLFYIFSPLQSIFMKRIILITAFLLLSTSLLNAQTDTLSERVKTGYNFGALPIVGVSTDVGVLYGVIFNMFNYGNGTIYPKYFQNLYMEVSRTSKGGRTYQMFFDSEHVLKGIRLTADISHLTEQALPFYGFNGTESVYHSAFEDDESSAYISRMFYRYDRKLTRVLVNLQGSVGGTHLKWLSGVQSILYETNTVDVDALNKGLKDDKKLPHVDGLYNDYVKWGLIDNSEKNGGRLNFLSLGTVYDTRDNEPNPNKGVWSEVILAVAPGPFNPEDGFTRLALTHRQYITLVLRRLTLAYRLNYRQTLSGRTPFYFLSYQLSSRPFSTNIDGLGGSNTIRGILRNRIIADGMAMGNAELRFKAWQAYWHNQNFYVSFTSFYDAGIVTKKREMNLSLVPVAERQNFFDTNKAGYLNQSVGLGMHLVMNQNFNVSFDYGRAFSKIDGTEGFYMGIGYIF
jgi:outer membrane protein assembly factor BamA